VLTDAIFIRDQLAQVNAGGATLYVNPSVKRLIPAGTIVIIGNGKEPFTRIRVSRAAIGLTDREPPQPAPEPPALIATVDGWAWKHYLIMVGAQALTGTHGVNLRAGPSRRAANIGMVKANSTVGRLGPPKGNYVPVRVRRNDFQEPVSLASPPPDPAVIPPENGYLGWVLTQYLSPLSPKQALTSRLGVNLRNKPDQSGQNIGLVKAFATVSLAGPTKGAYSPILARVEEVLNPAKPMPDIELPGSAPKEEPPKPVPVPDQNTTPGWSFTNGLIGAGDNAKTGHYGSNLRAAPRRDAKKIGYIPPGVEIIVTDSPSGEYTPVRVRDDRLKPPTADRDVPDLDSQILGQARIGLHASADPDIDEGEFQEFALMRPGIIKVLSFHSGEDIARLAAAHPSAHFVLRVFLSFGGRNISPGQFVDYTLKDVRRALARLKDRNVVVELHNEPNLVDEGLGSSWSDGTTFGKWWTDLLKRYRRALPGVRFIYPGLSPGTTVTGVKQDHIRFLEASRSAVEAADGLGIHLYWSNVYPMSQALAVLDDHISRFRARPIWITEASHNQGAINPVRMAQEYLRFWRELQSRPVVQGVTYFVASASEPKFAHEVWVGKGIARLIGRR
jgi:hypothetical protein